MGEIELALHAGAWPEDEFVRALDGAVAAGFRAIEIGEDLVPEYEDRVSVFQEMLSRQNVALAAISTRLRPVTAEVLEEEVERCANVARFLRANRSELLVLYPPPLRASGTYQPEDWMLAVEAITQIGGRSADLDVRTCLHPEPGTLIGSRREVDKIIELTDVDSIRLCLDTAFLRWAGITPQTFFKRHGSRVDYVHFRDIRKPGRFRAGRPPPLPKLAAFGRGAVNLRDFVKYMDKAKYNGWVTVELPGPLPDPVAAAAAARGVARKALNLV